MGEREGWEPIPEDQTDPNIKPPGTNRSPEELQAAMDREEVQRALQRITALETRVDALVADGVKRDARIRELEDQIKALKKKAR